jgi:acyl transferase domain-containing protein
LYLRRNLLQLTRKGCRWPGDVTTPVQLWELLINKRSGYSDFPPDRLNLEGFYHPSRHHPGTFYTKGGYFLSGDVNQFDHALFGISPVETRTLDPGQRKLLEVTFEAFDNAGEPWHKFSGSNTGVFVGNFNADHQIMTVHDADNPLPYSTTGSDPAILSNRVNYVFNLLGPSETVNTACSSSMYALHHAVHALRAGDCEKAIVAGTNIILDPTTQIFTTKLGAISPTSTCHTFDSAADGYARADGFGALYIMKLNDAIEGRYPIRAVIRGTAINAYVMPLHLAEVS